MPSQDESAADARFGLWLEQKEKTERKTEKDRRQRSRMGTRDLSRGGGGEKRQKRESTEKASAAQGAGGAIGAGFSARVVFFLGVSLALAEISALVKSPLVSSVALSYASSF